MSFGGAEERFAARKHLVEALGSKEDGGEDKEGAVGSAREKGERRESKSRG